MDTTKKFKKGDIVAVSLLMWPADNEKSNMYITRVGEIKRINKCSIGVYVNPSHTYDSYAGCHKVPFKRIVS